MDIAATVESDNQRGGGRDESGYSKKQGGGLAFGAVPNCRVLDVYKRQALWGTYQLTGIDKKRDLQ